MQKRNGDLQIFSDDAVVDGVVARRSGSSASNHMTMVPGVNYLEHQVSKMDTLAGLAIKYGVEVSFILKIDFLLYVCIYLLCYWIQISVAPSFYFFHSCLRPMFSVTLESY